MSERGKPRVVAVTIEPRSDPIAGRITLEDGAELDYCGYMQLVQILDRAREGRPLSRAADESPKPPPTQGPSA